MTAFRCSIVEISAFIGVRCNAFFLDAIAKERGNAALDLTG
jgi:hypothetical protein